MSSFSLEEGTSSGGMDNTRPNSQLIYNPNKIFCSFLPTRKQMMWKRGAKGTSRAL